MLLLPLLLGAYASTFDVYFYIAAKPQPMVRSCPSNVAPDFRNFDYTLGPLGPQAEHVALRDGHHDSPTGSSHEVAWETTIKQIQPLQLRGARAWLVILERNHLSGTGSFRHAFVFQCRRERLVRLLQVGGESLSQARAWNAGVSFEQAIWRRSDAHAAPSLRRTFTYRWNSKADRFELDGKTRPQTAARLSP
jgi:hypothetical protein